mgnify:FL=1
MQQDPKDQPDTGFSKEDLLGKQEQSEPAEQEQQLEEGEAATSEEEDSGDEDN